MSIGTLQGKASDTTLRGRRSFGRKTDAPLLAVMALTIVALAWGYAQGERLGLAPGEGAGYWIGIVGSLVLLATLAYPLRKYWRPLRGRGTGGGWLGVHMMFGIIGPAIILFHANFQLGALNSNVALISMLLVAFSGIVGRYLYTQIHRDLGGRRADLEDMVSEVAEMRRTLGADLPANSPMWAELTRLEAMARRPAQGVLEAVGHSLSLARAAARARAKIARRARQFIDAECKANRFSRSDRQAWRQAAKEHLDDYFLVVRRTARLIVFERLFSLWHLLHAPIFVLMLISTVVHVVAVHFF